jgi:hypothetical protein
LDPAEEEKVPERGGNIQRSLVPEFLAGIFQCRGAVWLREGQKQIPSGNDR